MSTTSAPEETHDEDAPGDRTRGGTTYRPRFDIWENDDEMILYGGLPGVMPEDLDAHIERVVAHFRHEESADTRRNPGKPPASQRST